MNKVIDILKSKWLKDTGRTAIVIAMIIVLFLGMNLIVRTIEPDDIDLSGDKVYTLTDESKEKIAEIPDDDKIEIYMFDYAEQDLMIDLVEQYSKVKSNIKVEAVKSEDRPDLVSKYNIEQGYYTVLIVAGDKSKTFSRYDFYTYDYGTGDSIDITEQRLTNGIIGLSSIGRNTPVYFLTGHDEKTTANDMILLEQYLDLENYSAKTLDLLSSVNVPEDCKCLVIASPAKDFIESEAKAIRDYVKNGR